MHANCLLSYTLDRIYDLGDVYADALVKAGVDILPAASETHGASTLSG